MAKNKSSNKKKIAIILVLLIVIGGIVVFAFYYFWPIINDLPINNEGSISYTEVAPIHIDDSTSNNWAWASNQSWCTGLGIEDDPYIIENLIINGLNSSSCISIKNSNAKFIVRNCFVLNASKGLSPNYEAGIKLENVSNGIITNINSTNNYIGFYLFNASNNVISNSIANQNIDYALHLRESYNNTISKSELNNNTRGIYLSDSDSNKLLYNTVNNNVNGIWISSSDNNTVKENIFNFNDHGIDVVSEAKYNKIIGNNISNNELFGVLALSSTMYNEFYTNNFLNNTIQAEDLDVSSRNLWYSNSTGNYWSDYGCEDLDGNGIGDDPYLIDGDAFEQDIYPSIKPFDFSNLNQNEDDGISIPFGIYSLMFLTICTISILILLRKKDYIRKA